jgi:hypothetical protein
MLTGVHGPETPEAPPPPGARLTRRALLGGSALVGASLVAAACTPAPGPEPSNSSDAPAPDADAQVRAAVAADEASLIALYDAVIAAHPALASDLAALRDEHREHAEAMGVTPTSAAAPVVGSRTEALAALTDAEKRAVAQRTAACEAAAAEDLARLTALIAASEAGHAEYLRGLT